MEELKPQGKAFVWTMPLKGSLPAWMLCRDRKARCWVRERRLRFDAVVISSSVEVLDGVL